MAESTKQEKGTKNRRTKYDEFTISVLKWGSIGLAFFAVAVGIISLFWDELLGANPDEAVIWFGLAVVAVLIPFIREITIKDIHLVLKDLEEAKEMLEATTITSRLLQDRITKTRQELIVGYNEYLKNLSPKEKEEKVFRMSQLYIDEMGLDVLKVKKWLTELDFEIDKMDNKINTNYIEILKSFQEESGLEKDGIFGYLSYEKMQKALEEKRTKN